MLISDTFHLCKHVIVCDVNIFDVHVSRLIYAESSIHIENQFRNFVLIQVKLYSNIF